MATPFEQHGRKFGKGAVIGMLGALLWLRFFPFEEAPEPTPPKKEWCRNDHSLLVETYIRQIDAPRHTVSVTPAWGELSAEDRELLHIYLRECLEIAFVRDEAEGTLLAISEAELEPEP